MRPWLPGNSPMAPTLGTTALDLCQLFANHNYLFFYLHVSFRVLSETDLRLFLIDYKPPILSFNTA